MRTKLGLISFVGITAVAAYTGCVSSERDSSAKVSADPLSAERDVAARSLLDESALVFYSTKARRDSMGNEVPTEVRTQVFTPIRWSKLPKEASARRQFLTEFYFANTRARSDSGRRNVACFTGTAAEAERNFFANHSFQNVENLRLSKSTDGLMLGLDFRILYDGKWTNQHFRMPSCLSAGKNFFFDPRNIVTEFSRQKSIDARTGRMPNAEETLEPTYSDKDMKEAFSRSPASTREVLQEGYAMLDQISGGGTESRLPLFQLKSDYSRSHQIREPFPWRSERLNLGTEEDAGRFALILKKYVYDGLANQNPNPNQNLIAQNSPRYWCHMPWLNQGVAGREAVHGLTKERDLYPSVMYPKATPGSDWGVAVFNAPACQAIDRTFGQERNPRIPPQTPEEWHRKTVSPDGSVIAKFLFTTAKFPQIMDAWQLIANVSPPKAATRSLQPIRHIQLDIAIKDSTLRGVPLGNADNWIMLNYYFDPTYDENFDIGDNMPMAIKKMRPAGLQWGFTQRDSRIFKGALTNNASGLLNGPADNSASSCLGCHGTAGTDIKMAPGVLTTPQYFQAKSKRVTLDFGQQFAFAKRNYETRSQAAAAN